MLYNSVHHTSAHHPHIFHEMWCASKVMLCYTVLAAALLHTAVASNVLRLNWTSGEVHTPLAHTIKNHQSKCTDKVYFYHQNNWGMGSDLHTWTQAVCNSMQKGATLLELSEGWIWNDRKFCNTGPNLPKKQPLSCYFNLEQHCPKSTNFGPHDMMMSFNHSYDRCPKYIQVTTLYKFVVSSLPPHFRRAEGRRSTSIRRICTVLCSA